jgi:hypothetical protein
VPRRRAPQAPAPVTGTVPPEIAVGAVVGVWGETLLDAMRGYALGRGAWERETGLDRATSARLVRARGPVEGAEALARLARHGLDLDDVPALADAASRLR